MRLRLAVIAAVLLLLGAFAARAEDAATPAPAPEEAAAAPVFEPGDVIVMGRREPAEIVGSVQELTQEDIRALGAHTAAEALQAIAGARVDMAPTSLSANGKAESLLSLRGFDPRDVIVLIDGVPTYEPFFRVLDLRQIPVSNIAKITVVKGPSSVLYGPNALGGVVNIVTKRGAGPVHGQVNASYGDYETYRGGGAASGSQNGLEYFANASFVDSGGWLMSRDFGETRNEDGGVRNNSDYRDVLLAGNVGYYRGLSGFTLTADHYQFAGGVPFSMEAVEPGTLWRETWKKTAVAVHGQWAAGDWLLARGRAFYTRFYNTIATYEDASMAAIADEGGAVSTYDNDVYGYVLLPQFRFGDFGSLTLSNIYKRDVVRTQDETGGKWRPFGAETYCAGAEYGLHVYRFDFTLGGAYNVYRRTETPNPELGRDDSSVDYQGGLAYTPLEMLTLFAAGAHKSAFPDLKTLYGSNGNPDLDPEFAYNFDAGVRLRPLEQFSLESTYFYSDVTDLIGKRDTGNEFYFENIDRALIQGVESLARVNVLRGLLSVAANHTWMATKDERASRRLHSLDFRPEHTAFVDGRVRSPFGVEFDAQYRYVGARRYELPAASRATRTMPEYGLTNLRLSYTLNGGQPGASCEFYAEARNVFDVYYEESPEKAAPGRNLAAGFTLDF
jgi:outer membrane receptor protein involved in Fe transport